MRKSFLRKVLTYCFVLVMLVTSGGLFACDELTLEDIPWNTYSGGGYDAIMPLVNDSISKMVGSSADSVALQVSFKTEIKYTFRKLSNGDFDNKEIVDQIEFTLTSAKDTTPPPTARIVTERRVNGVLSQRVEEIYVKRSNVVTKYVSTTDISLETARETTSLTMGEFVLGTSEDLFVNLFDKIVVKCTKEECEENGLYKTFEDSDYYMLSSSTASTKNMLNKKFSSNNNLIDNPSLFEVSDSGIDYVTGASYAYGMTKGLYPYFNYFTLDYSISRAMEDLDGKREKYLSVSMSSKLDKKGKDVIYPQEPENILDYKVGTFVNTLSKDSHYVVFNTSAVEGKYKTINILAKGGNKYLRVEDRTGSSTDATHYYELSNGVLYTFDEEHRTYSTFAPPQTGNYFTILNYDFSKSLRNVQDGVYNFGDDLSNFFVNTRDGNIISIGTSNEDMYLLAYSSGNAMYGLGSTSGTFKDISNFTYVE